MLSHDYCALAISGLGRARDLQAVGQGAVGSGERVVSRCWEILFQSYIHPLTIVDDVCGLAVHNLASDLDLAAVDGVYALPGKIN
jgi:hypothetical protein